MLLARLCLIAFVSVSVWLKRKLGRLHETEGRNLQKGQIMWIEWKHKGECHNNRYHINTAMMIYNSKNYFCICWLSFSLIRYSHFAQALSSVICSLLKRPTYCTVVAHQHTVHTHVNIFKIYTVCVCIYIYMINIHSTHTYIM